MNTKLTLSIEKDIIESSKKYAKEQNKSLSEIVENFLKSVTNPKEISNKHEVSSSLKSLRGSIKTPKNYDFDYKKTLQDARNKKHL